MIAILPIFIGGGAGAVCRYALSSLVARHAGNGFPWGTLAVNLAGAFAMGLVVSLLSEKITLSENMRLLLTTGFLGGFTTFSAFSLEAALMLQKGDVANLVAYVTLSVVGTVAALIIATRII